MYSARTVQLGGFDGVKALALGGDHPVVIQTMWKDRLFFKDLEGEAGAALIRRVNALSGMGCGLLRFAVPSLEDAEILGELASMVSVPVCADIHFDYTIALRCLDFSVAKLRINPGNIGSRRRVEAVVSKAAERGVPIRIGVNAGSLPGALRNHDRAEALVRAAVDELAVFDEMGFTAAVVSMKASGIADTIKANRLFARRNDAPLHIGVTEAGPLIPGTVRSTAALLPLLAEGIGDTIRISLSDTPENEVIAGREILNAVRDLSGAGETAEAENRSGRKRPGRSGAVIVSCPRCGRNGFDTLDFTGRWKERLYALDKDVTIAVMGCAVNGPGEAKHADLGITGAGNSIMIFRRGRVTRTIGLDGKDAAAAADRAFEEELEKL
ncbi:MAG: (E)-4-hydroxy-3-methylbut-2-enyl-diphosphate synthase [Spirochaetaceae bacterium]|jgi:(E)-4-hydroxy-3-methylbut-2-enyl-diphosphate synthase|nr:(E)-4-hydroxy-3-methylbut-2-enyl-diphosphate synthase [Spirochaetaceae bacterium]